MNIDKKVATRASYGEALEKLRRRKRKNSSIRCRFI